MAPNQWNLTHPRGPQCWHCSTSIIFPQNILTLDEGFHVLSVHIQEDRPGCVKNHSMPPLLELLLLELLLLSSSLSYSSMYLLACLFKELWFFHLPFLIGNVYWTSLPSGPFVCVMLFHLYIYAETWVLGFSSFSSCAQSCTARIQTHV